MAHIQEKNEWYVIQPDKKPHPFFSIEDYLEHCGKWMTYGQKEDIEQLAEKSMDLVDGIIILDGKYSKKPAPDVPRGFAPGEDYVLMYYCDDQIKDDVKKILKVGLKVKKWFWKYDWKTYKEAVERGEEIDQDIKVGLEKLGYI